MAARTFSRPNIACFVLPQVFELQMPRYAGSSTYCFLSKHFVFARGMGGEFIRGRDEGNLFLPLSLSLSSSHKDFLRLFIYSLEFTIKLLIVYFYYIPRFRYIRLYLYLFRLIFLLFLFRLKKIECEYFEKKK